MNGGDAYGQVRGGSKLRISARAWNGLMDMLKWWRRASTTGGGGLAPLGFDAGMILIRNNTGAALDEYTVVGLGEPLITPEDNERQFVSRVALGGEVPDGDEHVGKFAVAQEPIPDGKIGRALVSGVTPVILNHIHFSHKCADIQDGGTGLDSCQLGGARILWSSGAGGSASSSGSSSSSGGDGGELAYVVLGDNLGEFGLWAKITEVTQEDTGESSSDSGSSDSGSSSSGGDGSNRWRYAFAEVYKAGAGYGEWSTVPNGITGDSRNTIENTNSPSGMQGNGVDLDAYPGTILPLAVGDVVWIKRVPVQNVVEWWWSLVNAFAPEAESSSSSSA